MIRPIVRDPVFLSMASAEAGSPKERAEDRRVAADLCDTLSAHADHCVGMAANMIGVKKRIIAVSAGQVILVLINPTVTGGFDTYEAREGCLCHEGTRAAKRYRKITVRYLSRDFRPQTGTFEGMIAQAIQHEIDHCNGVLI